ncbi:MAG TPA: hypothetical protein LFV92_00195 [Rickettsia endosymbiont of Ceroptres masudai]|nr:hypothetical protein [Rickettsia endosymbiont of Ceroptres masudai]
MPLSLSSRSVIELLDSINLAIYFAPILPILLLLSLSSTTELLDFRASKISSASAAPILLLPRSR